MDVPPTPATAPAELPKDVRTSIADGWRRAQTAHANLALPLERFEADVLLLVARSRDRLGLQLDAAALRAETGKLHFEDLYLARLCEHGDERAWHALVARYEPDLRSVLRRHGDAAEAESVAAEVLSEIALAPPKGGSRTRLGTYDGTGPLWAWLATFGIRTLRARWRKRREAPLTADDERAAPADTPAADADDLVHQFLVVLRAAWEHLEDAERLALTWKHRDGLAQRVIARLLGVSEPTVSRLVGRGIAKLRSQVAEVATGGDPPDPELWTRLERALSAFLESSGALAPPDME